MQRGYSWMGEGGLRPRGIVGIDQSISHSRYRRTFFELRELVNSNPNDSIDELVAQLSASTLNQRLRANSDMSQFTDTIPHEEPHFWYPFPSDSRDKFFSASPNTKISIVMKANQFVPGSPPILFETPQTTLRPLLIALDPLAPQFAKIDESYNKSEHRLMDDIVEDSNTAEDRMNDADDLLRKYAEDRMVYVQCVSRRAQAVLGVRNERPVDLPKVGSRLVNKMEPEHPQHFYDAFPIYDAKDLNEKSKDLQLARLAEMRNGYGGGESGMDDNTKKGSVDPGDTREVEKSQANAHRQENTVPQGSLAKVPPPRNAIEALFRSNAAAKVAFEQARSQSIFTPSPLLDRLRNISNPLVVNRTTGAGLREFLTLKGKQGLLRKRECSSITFCDFTPAMITGEFRNKMLGHWTATREKGERIEVYEVDLQTRSLNSKTGREELRLQTWIWILMSRPLISLSATDTSTKLLLGPPRPVAYKTAYAARASLPKPAPTFPSPIPTSWIAFACPLENVTQFAEATEDVTHSAPSSSMAPAWRKLRMRQDYDFSHAGIPIFEYSSVELMSTMFPKDHIPKYGTKFLSVENLGGYDPLDFCGHLAPQVYIDKLNNREFTPEKWDQNEYNEDREAPAGLQSPKAGIWWEEFFKKVDQDKKTWEDIRSTMGRGACRVVVRWVETESLRQTEVNLESCEVRPLSTGSRLTPATKVTNKRGRELGVSNVSRKVLKGSNRPRSESKLGTEVMTNHFIS